MEARKISLPILIIIVIAAALIGGFFALFIVSTTQGGSLSNPLALTEKGNTTAEKSAAVNDDEEAAGSVTAEKILPSVVGIKATGSAGTNGLAAVTESSGSGVVMDERGYIVTNYHVIADSDNIHVVFHDNSEEPATVVGYDRRTDLALLKTEKDGLQAAAFAENEAEVGETAYAVGNPGGLEFAGTVTKGIISGLNRTIVTDDGDSFSLIQTDAAINPGNSGGALCNKNGEVIGINAIKISEAGFEGMGFAIPSATVQEIVSELLESGSVSRGALGVYLLCTVDETIAANYGTGIDHGVMISLQENGAAEEAGLKDYDIITAFNGETVTDMYDLQKKVFALDVGDTVTVTVYRSGETLHFTIVLKELEEE